jgi:hypothetical protein
MRLEEQLVAQVELLLADASGFYSWLEYGDGKEWDFLTAGRWVQVIERWLKEQLGARDAGVTDKSVLVSWWDRDWDVVVRVRLDGWLAALRDVAGSLQDVEVKLTRAQVLEVLTNHMS